MKEKNNRANYKTKGWFLEKISTIDLPLVRKNMSIQIINIRSERDAIIRGCTNIKRKL